ncbi:MAG: IPT/TIG domain-containing protein [Planctomycetota bacterium]|nr:IPT/TIG domain-containing protein [Planctomycetota bacterium]
MEARLRLALGLTTAAALATVAATHVRLRNPSNEAELFWPNPGAIGIVLSSAGSDNLAPGEHLPALRLAIDAWNRASGSGLTLVENTSPSAQSRTDWGNDNVHLMLFDESNTSGYFPQGSGTVAITPVQYFSNGRIADADVLFNGSGFNFTTSGALGAFDVGDVAAHELGHLLGLDHSGVAGATLYPYVDPTVIEHSSLAEDDEGGARAISATSTPASLSGTVLRQLDSSTVEGAHVVARDANGRTAGATLSGSDGTFTIRGLAGGTYTLYAAPLDAPVSVANLGGGQTIQTNFQPILSAPIAVAAGASASLGTLWVGIDALASLGRNYDEFPLRATAGAQSVFVLHGSGMGNGSTLTSSDPSVSVSPLSWTGTTMVTFTVNVPQNEPLGHVDLELNNGGLSILAGAIEIAPPDPVVTQVAPAQGPIDGGTSVVIQGSAFRPGASVVIGEQLYTDGAVGGCTVVDANTITLVTSAISTAGTYDVVVIDPSGVEGRAPASFDFSSAPQIDIVFPAAGADTGGTAISISGERFVAPIIVRIDGVVQQDVTLVSDTLLQVVTEPGSAGAPVTLEVEDGNQAIASALFQYTLQADPVLSMVSPSVGATSGGTEVTLSGANFTQNSSVVFGADQVTGLGGTAAASVTWVDAQTLLVMTPAGSAGAKSVAVLDGTTSQATLVGAGFTYQSQGGGGGGGGCGSIAGAPPMDAAARWGAAGWIPVLALLLALSQLRRRQASLSFVRVARR